MQCEILGPVSWVTCRPHGTPTLILSDNVTGQHGHRPARCRPENLHMFSAIDSRKLAIICVAGSGATDADTPHTTPCCHRSCRHHSCEGPDQLFEVHNAVDDMRGHPWLKQPAHASAIKPGGVGAICRRTGMSCARRVIQGRSLYGLTSD